MMRRVARLAIVGVLFCARAEAQQPDDSARAIGWQPVAIAAAAVAIGFTTDAMIAQSVHGTESPGTLTTARQFDRFGDPTGMVPIVGGLALVGVLTHNHHVERAAALALGSIAVASAVTEASKYAFGRVRPYADPDLDGFDLRYFSGSPSFPSGHTAAAFALATSLGDAVGSTWARIGLYALATGTGWARITEEDHWLSDVLAGAAVGIVSAKWASGQVHLFGMRAPRIMVGTGGAGLRWDLPFPGH